MRRGWLVEDGTDYWGPGSDYVAHVFVFHYLLLAQISPFRPSPSHIAADSHADLV
jgi:hypothetical protein